MKIERRLTSARSAMSSRVVAAKPLSTKSSIAASPIAVEGEGHAHVDPPDQLDRFLRSRDREHIERFFHSCDLMGLPVDPDAVAIREAIRETVRANPGARAVKIRGVPISTSAPMLSTALGQTPK